VSISIANTRLGRCAPLIAAWRGVALGCAPSFVFSPPLPRPAGVIAARNLLCGANTP
jgi:hypothetical protein